MLSVASLVSLKPARFHRLGAIAIASLLVATQSVTVAPAGNESGAPIVALAYDKAGHALLKSDGQVLYRSSDEGGTWESIRLPAAAGGKIAAIATPADGKNIVYVAGPGLGVLRTEDDGAHWTALSEGLPSGNVTAFAAHATQPATLYAYLPESGIYRSQDAGKSWRLMDRGPEEMTQLIHSSMAGSMESGWLYATTKEGVQLSMDCFCFWRDAGDLESVVRTVSFDPEKPELVYAATERGFFRSTDGGQNWGPVTGPESIVTAVVVGPSGALYAATEDGGLNRSTDRATTWEEVGD